jgi:hypothetical protein
MIGVLAILNRLGSRLYEQAIANAATAPVSVVVARGLRALATRVDAYGGVAASEFAPPRACSSFAACNPGQAVARTRACCVEHVDAERAPWEMLRTAADEPDTERSPRTPFEEAPTSAFAAPATLPSPGMDRRRTEMEDSHGRAR